MRSRGLVVAIAVVLAVAAAAAVVLYTQGVKTEAIQGGNLTTVIVSTQEIQPNTPLDPLLDQEAFREIQVPQDAVVGGAVTDLKELEGLTTTSTILANEQIPQSRLSSADSNPNRLGITEGHNVSVFATYQNVQMITGKVRELVTNPNAVNVGQKVDLPDFTVTLVPTVRVLAITNPEVNAETGQQNTNDRIRLTLDLDPQDAQNLVFAQENGLVWVGLLPPNEDGTQPPASVIPIDLLIGAKLK
jgi:hypothetical protein